MAELYGLSEEEQERYQEELKHYRDELNMLRTAHDRGVEEGLEKGLEKGLQEALNRLIASGTPADQAKCLLGMS